MKGKIGISVLAVAIALACIYNLSFTLISNGVKNDSEAYADQKVASAKELGKMFDEDSMHRASMRFYEDSIWEKEIYLGFTYGEIKSKDLNLGLDLQGGIHATVTVSREHVLKSLCNNPRDSVFLNAIEYAKVEGKKQEQNFVNLFASKYAEQRGKDKMWDIFASADNEEITTNESDDDVITYLETKVRESVSQAVTVLRSRIDKFGASQPNIQPNLEAGRIEIELPGVEDEERIIKQLKSVAELEFWVVHPQQGYFNKVLEINEYLKKNGEVELGLAKRLEANKNNAAPKTEALEEGEGLDELDATVDSTVATTDSLADTTLATNALATDSTKDDLLAEEKVDTVGLPILNYLFWTQNQEGGFTILIEKDKYESTKAFFAREDIQAILPSDWYFMLGKDNGGFATAYFVERTEDSDPLLSGEIIKRARADREQGQVVVSMSMTGEGSIEWERVTRENIGKQIAITLDQVVYSAPVVNQAISGGNSQISGGFSIEEAKDLANILVAGKLPAPTEIERLVSVGPSLGKKAIERGVMSLAIGLLLVVGFMVVYYSKSGMIANLALLFNLFLIIGIMAMPKFEAALTLPGMAGIVLTIGMSIDANVLIFERIREEMRSGVVLTEAITNGYSKAFWSIFDANVTTLATGIILYTFGTGLVKGFAITLIIGIVCSFFSAVFITRIIIEYLASKNKKISFETGFSKDILINASKNFIGKRKMAYMFSGIVIAAGVIVMATSGLNLGVSFKGGYSYVLKFDKSVSSTEVKEELTKAFKGASVEVKSFDGKDQVEVTTTYLLDAGKESEAQVRSEMLAALSANYGTPSIEWYTSVGASISDDIRATSLQSMILSLIVIFLYVFMRFRKWQFGLGAVIALFHDVLFVLSMFSFAGLLGFDLSIDEVFIAAVLTVVGYSINDTVVVFDRVRESIAANKNATLAETLNLSLNSTLTRTIMTSVTTLLVVFVLLVLGGEALRGFSFALFIGVIVGTYSSIFIATPIVLDASANGKFDAEEEKPAIEEMK